MSCFQPRVIDKLISVRSTIFPTERSLQISCHKSLCKNLSWIKKQQKL
ncbi:MAG: hypothetical protein QNJ54_06410 [Prochloraceae cyanobacterium]|nr:hypothetical protein [Prochloraceae cyanobacterium]